MAAENPSQLAPIPRFPSHHTSADISPQARITCQILSTYPPHEIEPHLIAARIQPEPELIQQVLKHSYSFPSTAAKFFRWAGQPQKHTAYSWNLMVDLLGKNNLFVPMWDAIRSMNKEGLLSLTSFVSVFENYCIARRFDEAVMAFDVMERYGVKPDIIAVNSLMSAMCSEDKQTVKALEFFEKIKSKIPPDPDSYAILLEGWEKEGNAAKAKHTFGEMVIRVGWSPKYMFAYDALLNTLVRASCGDEAIKFLNVMKGKNCLPGLRFFSNALDTFAKQNDHTHAIMLWDVMVGAGLIPNLKMYNVIIGLFAANDDIDNGFRFLDQMVFHGAFPNALTYNMIFGCLLKNKRAREAGSFFGEMVKNEWAPTTVNLVVAIRVMFEEDDPEMAIKMWKYMVKSNVFPRDNGANEVLIGLCKMGRMSDLRRFAENMIDDGIIISESTMAKVKLACYAGPGRKKREIYDRISEKWKSSCI